MGSAKEQMRFPQYFAQCLQETTSS
eukprot:SAG31_NODE_45604_length_258_cov_0.647799_1_plen_24_part_10